MLMKSIEPMTPSAVDAGSTQGPLSLEQLLSLESPVGERICVPSAEPASNALPAAERQMAAQQRSDAGVPPSTQRPLLLVMPEDADDSARLRGKLQALSREAPLQWMSLLAPRLDQLQGGSPQAAIMPFHPHTLAQASQLGQALQARFPGLLILAVGNMGDAASMLAALRIGVQDFLDIDTEEEALLLRLREILASKAEQPRKAMAEEVNSQLVVVMAARAGMGCSLLSTHLAQYVQQSLRGDRRGRKRTDEEKLHTLLLDFGSPANDGSLYLDVPVKFDSVQAMQNLRRFDHKLASTGLMQHASGLRVLPLSREAIGISEPSGLVLEKLLPSLRQFFPYIVADMGGLTQPSVLAQVAQQAAHIWVVCDQSLASVIATMELLQQLKAQLVPSSQIALIVGRYDAAINLGAVQIAEQLQLPLLCKVPERRVPLLQAINQGHLIAREMWRDPYAQAIQQLVKKVLITEVAPLPKSHYFAHLLQKIRR